MYENRSLGNRGENMANRSPGQERRSNHADGADGIKRMGDSASLPDERSRSVHPDLLKTPTSKPNYRIIIKGRGSVSKNEIAKDLKVFFESKGYGNVQINGEDNKPPFDGLSSDESIRIKIR